MAKSVSTRRWFTRAQGSWAPALAFPALLFLVACSGDGHHHTGDGGEDGTFYNCSKETRALPYMDGLQVASSDGALVMRVLSSDPSPPVKGNNTWTLSAADSDGTPLSDLVLTMVPRMPDHNHPSPKAVQITPGTQAGTYVATPVYLFMGGYWTVIVTAQSAAGASVGQVTFPICISG